MGKSPSPVIHINGKQRRVRKKKSVGEPWQTESVSRLPLLLFIFWLKTFVAYYAFRPQRKSAKIRYNDDAE